MIALASNAWGAEEPIPSERPQQERMVEAKDSLVSRDTHGDEATDGSPGDPSPKNGDREVGAAELEAGEDAPDEQVLGQCVSDHEAAQLAKLSGGLLQAQTHLIACSAMQCPQELRGDCVVWREELGERIPTVVVEASDAGDDIEDALIIVDDEVLRQRLDGRPLALNPGVHRIVLRLADGREKEKRIVLSEGQKSRKVEFTFGTQSAPPEAVVVSPQPRTQQIRPTPALTYVLAGVSVVSAGVALGFGVRALRMKNEADHTCAPLCDDSVTRAIRERATVSDLSWGVSVGGAIAAALVYAYRPTQEVPMSDVVALDLVLGKGRGSVYVGGQF